MTHYIAYDSDIPEIKMDGSTVYHVALDIVYLNRKIQVRNKIDNGTVRRYFNSYKNGQELPPIELAFVNNRLMLIDGWHRFMAKENLVRKLFKPDAEEIKHASHIKATIRELDYAEAAWQAAKANTKNGIPLKTSELRKVFNVFIRTKKFIKDGNRGGNNRRPEVYSFREIAAIIGSVSHMTVKNWMEKNFPQVYSRYYKKQDDEDYGHGKGLGKYNEVKLEMKSITEAINEIEFHLEGLKDSEEHAEVYRQLKETMELVVSKSGIEPEELDERALMF